MLGIYCRKSQKSTKVINELSIKEQRLLGMECAKKLNLKYKVYTDEYVSGTKFNRKALDELKADIMEGTISSIYYQELTRLSRNQKLWIFLKELYDDYNLKFFNQDGLVDLDNLTVRFTNDILMVFSEMYAKETGRKINKVLDRKANEGTIPNGMVNYGYIKNDKQEWIIDSKTEGYVRLMFSMSLDGKGFKTIARELNRLGAVSPTRVGGKEWEPSAIWRIVRNPVYTGEKKWRNHSFKIPAYFDKTYHKKVTDRLKLNATNTGKEISKGFIARGVIKCSSAKCIDRPLTAANNRRDKKYYNCPSNRSFREEKCGLPAIQMEWVDHLIWTIIKNVDYLHTDVLTAIENKKNDTILSDLRRNIDKYEESHSELLKERKNLLNAVRKGLLDDDDVYAESRSIKTKIQDIENKILDSKKDLKDFDMDVSDTIKIIDKANKLKNASRDTKIRIVKEIFKDITYTFRNDPDGFDVKLVFNNPNIPFSYYFIDKRYRYATSTLIFRSGDVANYHYIPLRDDLKQPKQVFIAQSDNLMEAYHNT